MKEKVSNITFFIMLVGFVLLVASFAMHNEAMAIAALLIILPSITLNVAKRGINLGHEEI